MDANELKDGFHKLDELSNFDYLMPLEQLLDAPTANDKKLIQLGRLIGITLKEPFSEPRERRDAPSTDSGAYHQWKVDPGKLADASSENTWQYRTLDALRADPAVHSFVGDHPTVANFALGVAREDSFFRCLAVSLTKYVCGDAKIRKEIDKSLKEAKKAGLNVAKVTPDTLVQSGGVALASYLIVHVPVLGFVGAPVIAGLILLLYRIGIDAFCQYAQTHAPATQE